MRILLSIAACFLLIACQPKNKNGSSSMPIVEEKLGIYKNATFYTGKTTYEFEIDGKSQLISIPNYKMDRPPKIPTNLLEASSEGIPGPNPLLIGKKYVLKFGPQSTIKSIELSGNHDPSNPELPAIPTNYSGLLSVAPADNSRAYLDLAADLTAILLINYGDEQTPIYKAGRWTRSEDGNKVSVQFAEEDWQFTVKENALALTSQQMGSGGLSLMASESMTICHFVNQLLSDLSTTDNEKRVDTETIQSTTPLSEILRTEHAYMGLYGQLDVIFGIKDETIAEGLRANPTAQGVCGLVYQSSGGGH